MRREAFGGCVMKTFRVSTALFLLAVSAPAFAQVTSAVIQGVVTDSQGGVLPGVTVVVTNVETGLVREAAEGPGGICVAQHPRLGGADWLGGAHGVPPRTSPAP